MIGVRQVATRTCRDCRGTYHRHHQAVLLQEEPPVCFHGPPLGKRPSLGLLRRRLEQAYQQYQRHYNGAYIPYVNHWDLQEMKSVFGVPKWWLDFRRRELAKAWFEVLEAAADANPD